MIPNGIPESAEAWPTGLLRHLQRFEQGHVIRDVPFFYYADDSRQPVFGEPTTDPSPLIWDEEDFRFGLIVTQTCDLQEADARKPKKPWLHVCPMYRVDSGPHAMDKGTVGHAKKDRIEHLIWVPELGEEGVWLADLRLLLPLDKSVLRCREPIEGFADEASRLQVGRRMALIHDRPAFDGHFVGTVVVPLRTALTTLAKADPELFAEIRDTVYAVAVQASRLADMSMESVEVCILCWQDLSDEAADWWEQQSTAWSEAALRSPDLRIAPAQVRLLDETTAAELLRLTVVPLGSPAVTPHPLWYAEPIEPT